MFILLKKPCQSMLRFVFVFIWYCCCCTYVHMSKLTPKTLSHGPPKTGSTGHVINQWHINDTTFFFWASKNSLRKRRNLLLFACHQNLCHHQQTHHASFNYSLRLVAVDECLKMRTLSFFSTLQLLLSKSFKDWKTKFLI